MGGWWWWSWWWHRSWFPRCGSAASGWSLSDNLSLMSRKLVEHWYTSLLYFCTFRFYICLNWLSTAQCPDCSVQSLASKNSPCIINGFALVSPGIPWLPCICWGNSLQQGAYQNSLMKTHYIECPQILASYWGIVLLWLCLTSRKLAEQYFWEAREKGGRSNNREG